MTDNIHSELSEEVDLLLVNVKKLGESIEELKVKSRKIKSSSFCKLIMPQLLCLSTVSLTYKVGYDRDNGFYLLYYWTLFTPALSIIYFSLATLVGHFYYSFS